MALLPQHNFHTLTDTHTLIRMLLILESLTEYFRVGQKKLDQLARSLSSDDDSLGRLLGNLGIG